MVMMRRRRKRASLTMTTKTTLSLKMPIYRERMGKENFRHHIAPANMKSNWRRLTTMSRRLPVRQTTTMKAAHLLTMSLLPRSNAPKSRQSPYASMFLLTRTRTNEMLGLSSLEISVLRSFKRGCLVFEFIPVKYVAYLDIYLVTTKIAATTYPLPHTYAIGFLQRNT